MGTAVPPRTPLGERPAIEMGICDSSPDTPGDLPLLLPVTQSRELTVVIHWSREGLGPKDSKTITALTQIDRSWKGKELSSQLCSKYHDYRPPADPRGNPVQLPIGVDVKVNMRLSTSLESSPQFAEKSVNKTTYQRENSRGLLRVEMESELQSENSIESSTIYIRVDQQVTMQYSPPAANLEGEQ